MPRLFSFHHDSWEGDEEAANLTMEDSWQTLLDDPEVNKHAAASPSLTEGVNSLNEHTWNNVVWNISNTFLF